MSDFIATLNYHSHIEADDCGHSLTPPRQICRAGVELCLASWCEAFCAAERSYPEQSPEWYDGVEIAVGWNGFSQIPVIDKGRANRHARGLFHFCDFGSNLVYDTFLDTGSPLDFHHALRTLRRGSWQHCQQLGNLLRVAGGVGSDAAAEAVDGRDKAVQLDIVDSKDRECGMVESRQKCRARFDEANRP